MSIIKTATDSFYAVRMINLIRKPWTEWGAFKLGIISDSGAMLRKPKTDDEKSAYTPFHASVRSLKRVMSKIPTAQTIMSFTMAYDAIASRYGITESETCVIQSELSDMGYSILSEALTVGDAENDPIKIASGEKSGTFIG